jgi:hypothetical protein
MASRIDPIPNIRAAGKIIAMGNESAELSLKSNGFNNGNPGTPEHIKKYRKSFQNQPGIKQVHPGLLDLAIPVADNHAFGKKQVGTGDAVHEVIKAQNLKVLADKFNDIKESKYHSQIREPLGVGYERGYNWPGIDKDKFQFGVATMGSESAKDVLYPLRNATPQLPEDEEKIRAMYAKTHGNFGSRRPETTTGVWIRLNTGLATVSNGYLMELLCQFTMRDLIRASLRLL